jgi:hypothetical protein
VVRDDHALKLLSRLLVVLMTAALLVGGTVSLAATDGGAAVAKKKCEKKRATGPLEVIVDLTQDLADHGLRNLVIVVSRGR